MATIPKQKPSVAHTRSGGPPYTRSWPEAASQTFKKGDFVVLSSGKVTLCADDAGTILGIAAQDASGVTDTMIPVIEANDDTVFIVNGISTTAVTQVGTTCAVDLTSTNWTVDTADTTGGVLVVTGLDPRDAVGDTNGRLHVTVLSSARQTCK